jgi:hypothetical protein
VVDKVDKGASGIDGVNKLGCFVSAVWAVPIAASGQIGKGFPKDLSDLFLVCVVHDALL